MKQEWFTDTAMVGQALRISALSVLVKKGLYQSLEYENTGGTYGPEIEEAYRQFGRFLELGRRCSALLREDLLGGLTAIRDACPGVWVSYNNGIRTFLSLPDPEEIWEVYCYRRNCLQVEEAGSGLLGAYLLVSTRMCQKQSEDRQEGAALAAILPIFMVRYETEDLCLENIRFDEDPFLFFISVARALFLFLQQGKGFAFCVTDNGILLYDRSGAESALVELAVCSFFAAKDLTIRRQKKGVMMVTLNRHFGGLMI